MSKLSLRLISLLLLVLIVVLAAVLRFSHLELSSIGTSQSFLLRVAVELVNKGKWPLAAGQNAVGATIPPLIEYLLAMPLLVRRELLTAVSFFTLLNLLAVPLLYLYARTLFGRQTALIAAFLLAVHPWAVYSSRVIAPEHAALFWSVIALGSGLMLVRHGRFRWHLLLTVIALTALTQLYFRLPVIVLAAATLLLLVAMAYRRQTASARRWLAAAGAALIMYLPYWRFERTTGYANVQALWSSWRGETAVTDGSVFTHLWQLITGGSLWRQFPAWETAVAPWYWLGTLLAALFVLGWVMALLPAVQQWQQKRTVSPPARVTAALALWLLLAVLAFLHHAPPLAASDLLFLLPAVCLLIALAVPPLVPAPEQRRRPTAAGVGMALVLIGGGWMAHGSWVGMQTQAAGNLTSGQTVQKLTTAVAQSRTHLTEYPDCELIVLGPGSRRNTSPWGIMAEFVHPTPVRFVEQDRGFIIPPQCSLYFVAGQDAFADRWLNEHARPLPAALQTESVSWRFYYLPTQEVSTITTDPTAWRNGLLLRRVDVPETAVAGQPLSATYTWQVLLDPLAGSQFQFFNHLLNENGEIVAQEDGPGIPTATWQPGDTLITHFYLQLPADLPAGTYTLNTGLYTWPDLQRIRLRHSMETAASLATITIP